MAGIRSVDALGKAARGGQREATHEGIAARSPAEVPQRGRRVPSESPVEESLGPSRKHGPGNDEQSKDRGGGAHDHALVLQPRRERGSPRPVHIPALVAAMERPRVGRCDAPLVEACRVHKAHRTTAAAGRDELAALISTKTDAAEALIVLVLILVAAVAAIESSRTGRGQFSPAEGSARAGRSGWTAGIARLMLGRAARSTSGLVAAIVLGG
jgi:hypothetical protein